MPSRKSFNAMAAKLKKSFDDLIGEIQRGRVVSRN